MDSHVEADLPPTLACLKSAETLLRCPICFDFLNIAMMTKCSHNFCSLCIRKFLSYKLQCPVCNTGATEDDLRNNRILDDLVLSFRAARQQLSKTFESPPISPETPQKSLRHKNSSLSRYFQQRCKTSVQQPKESVSQCSKRKKLHVAHHQSEDDSHLHTASTSTSTIVKEEPMEVQVPNSTAVQEGASMAPCVAPVMSIMNTSSLSDEDKPVIKVECPVCSVNVSQQFINKHLDTCLSSGEKKESLRSSIGKGRRPMNKLVYNLLSRAELRRRMKECHLSVQGTRDQMIKRHKEFVHVYNAQCDSLNPKSAEEIAKEVETNEKVKNQLQAKAKPVMVFTKNQTEEEINEMHSEYRKQHSSDFSRLVAEVRSRMDTDRQTRIKQEITTEGEDKEKPQSTKSRCSEAMEAQDNVEECCTGGIRLSMSPTYSDVSVSSSISDIFGPESSTDNIKKETTSVVNPTSCSKEGSSASSPVRRKRQRKTEGNAKELKGKRRRSMQ